MQFVDEGGQIRRHRQVAVFRIPLLEGAEDRLRLHWLALVDDLASLGRMQGLDDDLVEVACRRADADVWVANFNAPGQIVIAGSVEGVAKATEQAKALGAKRVMALPVSGAFHTPYMTSARERLREAIALAKPRNIDVPVISNVDARAHDSGEEWSTLLSAQLSSPVRWKHCLLTMAEAGIVGFIELGPGGVLTGMAKRTIEGSKSISVATPDDLDKLIEWIDALQPTATLPPGSVHEGEHLFAVERMVVSPAAGLFQKITSVTNKSRIEVGQIIGHVAETEVRSPFSGVLQNFIAVDGERVTAHQPIAWLRTH
jgi:[acyl-carrier-protein] S-malonyltransferase